MKQSIALITLVTAGLLAQTAPTPRGPKGPPPVPEATKTYLGLSDAQVQSLQQIQQQLGDALRTIHTQIREKQQALGELRRSGSTDATAMGQLLVDIENLQKEVGTTHDSYRTQAQAVLNPDQKTKLAALEAAAQLQPAIHGAAALNLMAPPQGPGPGMKGMRARGDGGPMGPMRGGPGPRMMRGQPPIQ
jgi:Spy/CpxP family protein refolding chaperone